MLSPYIFHCGFLVFLWWTFPEFISFSSTCSGSLFALTYDSEPCSFPPKASAPGWVKDLRKTRRHRVHPNAQLCSKTSLSPVSWLSWPSGLMEELACSCLSISSPWSWGHSILALPRYLCGCLVPLLSLHPQTHPSPVSSVVCLNLSGGSNQMPCYGGYGHWLWNRIPWFGLTY